MTRVTAECPAELLHQAGLSIARQTGLDFPRERWAELERGLRAAAPRLGFPDAASCARQLPGLRLDRRAVEILAAELTVGETYFFREKRSLELCFSRIVPELARGGGPIRIWCAGCCTGEEPYTLAIMLDRLYPGLPVSILGTDINPRFLRKASEGIYSEWSFRDAPPWLKPEYFHIVGPKRHQILPRIRKQVTFAWTNLAGEMWPPPETGAHSMDLIFCRNVLMYFGPKTVRRVVRRFRDSLTDRGWLVVGVTEVSSTLAGELTAVPFPEMTFYRKRAPEPVTTSLRAEPVDAPFYPEAGLAASFLPREEVAAALPELEIPLPEVEAREAMEAVPEPASRLARACANRGDLAGALVWTEKALATNKLDVEAHYLRALVLQESEALPEAVESFRRALYLEPDFILAHFALGTLAMRQRNHAGAGVHYANVRELLARLPDETILPHSDGLAAGKLREMVAATLAKERLA